MTAELAVVLPAVTALLALLLLAVSAGMLQLRLEEGARAGARALARGDSSAQVVDTVTRLAGQGTAVSLAHEGAYASVTVQGRAGGVLSGLVPWEQTARATAHTEEAGPRGER
ncbi:TadE family type IV pilus minor pilin [Specibacter sp. NPDC057265]|uniref:TadE family type IV pilus minor pilin n=1 Tax=Specibacter sp. NPDC057265 TaxID=3346075 RepID=UPI00363427D4